jgi:transcriptional regulator with XRE-family HTH domain
MASLSQNSKREERVPEGRERHLLSKRLRELRGKKDLTQADLAELAGLTASAISQFESGVREPNFSSLVKLARALDVSPSFLSGLEEYDLEPEIRAFYREHQELSEGDRAVLRLMAARLREKREEEG